MKPATHYDIETLRALAHKFCTEDEVLARLNAEDTDTQLELTDMSSEEDEAEAYLGTGARRMGIDQRDEDHDSWDFTVLAYADTNEELLAKLDIEDVIENYLSRRDLEAIVQPHLNDETEKAIIEEYSPDYVSLYSVSYDDDLRGHVDILDECVQKNDLYPLTERCYDWWDYPEGYYLNEIKEKMQGDGIEELFDELEEEFKEVIWEKDDSTPVDDLLGNTGAIDFFYSLGEDIEGWSEPAFLCEPQRLSDDDEVVAKIMGLLHLPADHPSKRDIEIMVAQDGYGGDLRIYFSAELKDVLNDPYCDGSEDFKSIHFKGNICLCIADSLNGSGDMCEVKGVDIILPFVRENLHISSVERYSAEDIYGYSWGWTEDYDSPTLSLEPAPEGVTVEKSSVNAVLNREAEYERTFRAGGCTLGDTKFSRHRDVEYINSVPCGSRCPHCGQFWID